MDYLIGIDAGSTGIKAVALGNGAIAASAHTRMEYHHEGDIWEYDPVVYYNKIAALVRDLVSKMPSGSVCKGLTLVSASGNTLLLRENTPLTPIISWMDGRGEPERNSLFPYETEGTVHAVVGWHMAPKFPLVQLSFLRRHSPALLRRADRICEGSCYVNYRLCGVWALDHSAATTFYLQDQRSFSWNKPYLETLGISPQVLPELVPVGTRLGGITRKASEETGLPVGTPVIIGCYDGAAAARSAGILRTDQMLVSCGTSWVCIYPSRDRQSLLDLGTMIDPYLESQGLWIGMTSLGEVGVLVEEILRQLLPGSDDRIRDFNLFAARSVPGANGLMLNPMRFSMGDFASAPLSDVCRALMEGVVYSLRRQKESLPAQLPEIAEVLMAGGPSTSPLWPQILSDVMQLPVRVSGGSNACALGAAILAGIGSGLFADLAEARRCICPDEVVFRPSADAGAVYENRYQAFVRQFPGLDSNMH